MNPVPRPDARPRQLPIAALALVPAGLLCATLAWWLPSGTTAGRWLLAALVVAPTLVAGALMLRQERSLLAARAALGRCAEHEHGRELVVQTARRERDLLVSALDQLPIGIAVFDRRDQPVLRNRHLERLLPGLDEAQRAAPGHQELLHHERRLGVVPQTGHEAAQHADGSDQQDDAHVQSILLQYPGDRWIQGLVARSDRGRTVVARADVTALARAQHQATKANEKLSHQSATDGLTGITNRRRFDEILATEWLRAARSGSCLSLLMVDIDHFKRFNDHYGHVTGDECLRQVAQLLHDCVRRAGEVVARYGGEEFVILLPTAEVAQAEELAQRCLEGIARLALPHASSPTADHLTFSIGIAHVFPSASHDPVSLVSAADAAMYRAKMAGRARYEVADLADWEIDKDAPRSRPGELH